MNTEGQAKVGFMTLLAKVTISTLVMFPGILPLHL